MTNEELLAAIKEELTCRDLTGQLISSISSDEWERIWRFYGGKDEYGFECDLSLTGAILLLRLLAKRL